MAPFTGERNGNNRWTNKEAKQIREFRYKGWNVKDLRRMYGGSESTMWALLTGKSYKDAGGPIAGVDYPKGLYNRSVF